jgi:hypothetical protein
LQANILHGLAGGYNLKRGGLFHPRAVA